MSKKTMPRSGGSYKRLKNGGLQCVQPPTQVGNPAAPSAPKPAEPDAAPAAPNTKEKPQ